MRLVVDVTQRWVIDGGAQTAHPTTMNRITKINPVIAPQAHAEIAKRCLESSNGTAVFKGLCYEITVGGEVWHIGRGTQTFENDWDDVSFGLEALATVPVIPETITAAELDTPRRITRTVYSDRDSRDRQFKWTLFGDGSALSEELVWHTGDPARPVKVTWSETHPAGSDMANSIASIPN